MSIQIPECAPADIDDPSFYLTNTIDGFKLNPNPIYQVQDAAGTL